MNPGGLEYYLKLNKAQKAKFNYDLAVERAATNGIAPADGVEWKLANTRYYHTYRP